MPDAVDTLGLKPRDPAGWDLSVAKASAEASPFAGLVNGLDAFFGDELDEALAGPEAAEAETEVRRIIAEHIAAATVRLAATATAISQVNLATAHSDALQSLAGSMLQRAADQRFVELVAPLVRPTE